MNKIILIVLISYSQAVKIHSLSQLGVKFDLDGVVAAAEETVDQTVESVVETADTVVTSNEEAYVE